MHMRLFGLLWIAWFSGITPTFAAPPPAEQKKIDALLTHVAGLADARFIRNGKEYGAKDAAKFLRKKGEANDKKIHSAKDFIAVAATKSSTTGKPYQIRLKGGAPTPCADYLTARLREMEGK